MEEEAGRKKAQEKQGAAINVKREILKRAESSERVRKAREARKAAADKRRNFGGP